jgi:drug/metabolite transporter (DMT)-like permease
VAAALVFGLAAVIEQRSTKLVRQRRALSPRLLVDLARQPLWLAGICADLAGFVLQVVALRFGPLALVEPILVCDLIFAAVISAYLRRRWDPVMFTGVVACAAGVAGFLAIARPSGGESTMNLANVLPLAAALAAAVAGSLALARRSRRARPLALALACGINYGVAAFLVKLITSDFRGVPSLLASWPIYALAVVAPLGFLLNQNAFQQGTLISPVLAVITATDPLVSIGIAHFWLHESLTGSPAGVAGAVVSLALMTAGIVALAHRAPVAAGTASGLAQVTTCLTVWSIARDCAEMPLGPQHASHRCHQPRQPPVTDAAASTPTPRP